MLLLSPQTSQEKIRQGIIVAISKEAGAAGHAKLLDENAGRSLLKERVKAIKLERISEVRVPADRGIRDRFLDSKGTLKPRHQRDVKRLMSLIKSFALLNLWWRERDGSTITANDEDVSAAFALWDCLSESQELNLPPYMLDIFKDVFQTAWNEKRSHGEFHSDGMFAVGLSRREIRQKHQDRYGRPISMRVLTEQVLPMLETAGLIVQEADPKDGRQILAYPAVPLKDMSQAENNIPDSPGVNEALQENLEAPITTSGSN